MTDCCRYVVYQLANEAGVIYIGCTSLPRKREVTHRRNHPDHEFQVVAQFANRQHALAYEVRLIREERPPLNVQGNPDVIIARDRAKRAVRPAAWAPFVIGIAAVAGLRGAP